MRVPRSTGGPDAVQLGDDRAALELELVTVYGPRIPELAEAVRRAVTAEVRAAAGIELDRIDVTVRDVVPGEEGPR